MYLEIDRKKTKEIGRKLSETQDFLFKTTYQSYKEGEWIGFQIDGFGLKKHTDNGFLP